MLHRFAAFAIAVALMAPGRGTAGRKATRHNNFAVRVIDGATRAVGDALCTVQARWFVHRLKARDAAYSDLYRETSRRAFKAAGGGTRPFPMLGKAGWYYLRHDIRLGDDTARMAVIERATGDGIAVPAPVTAHAQRLRGSLPELLLKTAEPAAR